MPIPAPENESASLRGSRALASNDIWAVGAAWPRGRYSTSSNSQTLAEHWDGKSWRIVSTPSLPKPAISHENRLAAVDGVSANDVWAVGAASRVPLIEHWDGASWKIVPTPKPGQGDSELTGIATPATDDIWVVGNYRRARGGSQRALVEHWNGRSWRVIPTPGGALTGVDARSRRDVWVVGSPVRNYVNYNLVEHWTGVGWKVVPSSHSPGIGLDGVSALSRRDVWAVGLGSGRRPVIEHWNGIGLTSQSSPGVGCKPKKGCDPLTKLDDVVAVSRTDVWAVGSAELGLGIRQALVERYSCK